METIEDIRREAGNPRHAEVGGPPRSVHKFFGEASVPMFAAFALFVAAVVLIALGVFTLVFPIAIVGFMVLAASGFMYVRSRSKPL